MNIGLWKWPPKIYSNSCEINITTNTDITCNIKVAVNKCCFVRCDRLNIHVTSRIWVNIGDPSSCLEFYNGIWWRTLHSRNTIKHMELCSWDRRANTHITCMNEVHTVCLGAIVGDTHDKTCGTIRRIAETTRICTLTLICI